VSHRLPDAADKPRYVADMFARIARRYDLMNTLMTGGQVESWRRIVADLLDAPESVLDVGTGTAGLLRAIQARWPAARVVGVDFTLAMLLRAPAGARLVAGDALQVPFADSTFQAVVSAFVVRNLADARRGLAEQTRVLAPGGQLVILETTPGPGGPLGTLFRLYFEGLVPLAGGLVSGDLAAYRYLPASTAAFVEPEHLADILRACGLRDVGVRRLALGSVAITTGRKP
jgi:demethylmenaquinone methyltransferase / 2-methoxy-6-polyprenyl-1,4-benzoquinol methylase